MKELVLRASPAGTFSPCIGHKIQNNTVLNPSVETLIYINAVLMRIRARHAEVCPGFVQHTPKRGSFGRWRLSRLSLQVCSLHRETRSIGAIGDGAQDRTKSLINELPHQIFVLNPARRCAAVDAPSPRMRQADVVKMFSVESIWRIPASRGSS